MEMLKSWLKANVCHPLNNIFTIVANGNNINLKWKLDFVECMKSKSNDSKSIKQPKTHAMISSLYMCLYLNNE
jgi:hypothetical protein